MNKKSLKAGRHVVFELDQDGKDKLGIIAMPGNIRNFLSEFPYFVQAMKEKGPMIHFSWLEGKFKEDENVYDLNPGAGQDRLSLITNVESLLNFFSCIVEHFREEPENPKADYFFKYKGSFKNP